VTDVGKAAHVGHAHAIVTVQIEVLGDRNSVDVGDVTILLGSEPTLITNRVVRSKRVFAMPDGFLDAIAAALNTVSLDAHRGVAAQDLADGLPDPA